MFALDINDAVLDLDMAAAVLLNALHVLVTALLVRRMIGRIEHLADEILPIVAHLLHEALPDGGCSTGIVPRVRDVLECKSVRFPFVRTADRHLVDLRDNRIEHDISKLRRIRHIGKNLRTDRHVDLLAPAIRHVVLHAMPHLMPQDDGNLILILQIIEKPAVDRHHVAERAKGIEGIVLIDKPKERLVVDRRIALGNARRNTFDRTTAKPLPRGVFFHAKLFLVRGEKRLPPRLRLVEFLDLLLCLGLCLEATYDRTDEIAPTRIRHRSRLQGEASPKGEHTRCESRSHTFLPSIHFHHLPCSHQEATTYKPINNSLLLHFFDDIRRKSFFIKKTRPATIFFQRLHRKSLFSRTYFSSLRGL